MHRRPTVDLLPQQVVNVTNSVQFYTFVSVVHNLHVFLVQVDHVPLLQKSVVVAGLGDDRRASLHGPRQLDHRRCGFVLLGKVQKDPVAKNVLLCWQTVAS